MRACKTKPGPGYELLLEDLKARVDAGNPVTTEELVTAIVNLEPRQAEALVLRKWGIKLDVLLDLQALGRLDALDRLPGMTFRAAGEAMTISHVRVQALVQKASINLLGWLTA